MAFGMAALTPFSVRDGIGQQIPGQARNSRFDIPL